MELETRGVWPVDLEVRRRGGGATLYGLFRYGGMATIRDRGRVRKETFAPNAFDFAVNQELDRPLDVLLGHSMDRPIGSRRAGTARFEDGPDGLRFEVDLPDEAAQPTYLRDFMLARDAGMVSPGVSPGFRVPPSTAVPNAEELVPEPGNPGVMIRKINHAVLREVSLVTAAAYEGTEIDVRGESATVAEPMPGRRMLAWL